LQSQWVALSENGLTARSWPFTLRIPLEELRLAVWVRASQPRGWKTTTRLAHGAIWLAHEDEQGELALSKVLPGPPDDFLERLAQEAPHCRVIGPEGPVGDAGEYGPGESLLFVGRPLISTMESASGTIAALLGVAIAFYLASISSWWVGGVIALTALVLLWRAARPHVGLDNSGVLAHGVGSTRLFPWAPVVAVVMGRGRGLQVGHQVFLFARPAEKAKEPGPWPAPRNMVAMGVSDGEGLFAEIAAAAGLRVEGDIAYRA
ncbi:hypothetical protein IIA16_05840, partial [bacterium]|nr:hypothetical protein [bacterium]